MEGSLEQLDSLIRGAITGLLLLFGLAILRRRPLRHHDGMFALLCVGHAIYVLMSSPTLTLWQDWNVGWIDWISIINPFLVWWCGLALFRDDFDFESWHFVPLLGVTLPAIIDDWTPEARYARALAAALMFCHLIFVAVRSAPGDLVESRRAFRPWFIIAAGIFGLIVTVAEVRNPPDRFGLGDYLFQSGSLFIIFLSLGIWLLGVRTSLWPEPDLAAPPKPSPLPGAEQLVLAKLKAAVADEIWREPGLTIGHLAEQLDVPEHRLRRVINQGLGYRNFASFMNEHRIATACSDLADPALADKSILTIAYDVGFASLGPFNRAFRHKTGQSPSAFRREKIPGSTADPEIS